MSWSTKSAEIKTELYEWKSDLSKLWDVIHYFTKEAFSEYNYVVTAVNGSAILEQRITKSHHRWKSDIKSLQDKWGARNVRFDSVRVD